MLPRREKVDWTWAAFRAGWSGGARCPSPLEQNYQLHRQDGVDEIVGFSRGQAFVIDRVEVALRGSVDLVSTS